MLFKRVDRELRNNIESLGKWYYYINFNGIEVRRDLKPDKANGFSNWNNYLKCCMPDVRGKRILDIGCNAGIYDLEMAKMGAKEVIGLDLNTDQALFTKEFFAKKQGHSFDSVRFIKADARDGLPSLGRFDFVSIFCAVYHFKEKIDFVMDQISKITNTVVLQGNTRRLDSSKYAERPGNEYSGIDGMKELLRRHGFNKLHIFAMNKYPKPVVIGER